MLQVTVPGNKWSVVVAPSYRARWLSSMYIKKKKKKTVFHCGIRRENKTRNTWDWISHFLSCKYKNKMLLMTSIQCKNSIVLKLEMIRNTSFGSVFLPHFPSPYHLSVFPILSSCLSCPPHRISLFLWLWPSPVTPPRHLPPPYFSVDGDLSRPWLMLAQPPPPLCSLWWWGSLCCDTDADVCRQSRRVRRRLT